jgi:hypothetical protein
MTLLRITDEGVDVDRQVGQANGRGGCDTQAALADVVRDCRSATAGAAGQPVG